MTQPTLLMTARKSALLDDHDNTLDLLVQVQAPDLPENELQVRPPMNVSFVLDRSGSMNGRPLEEAKRCACSMIDGLTRNDRASVIAYDGDVDTVIAARQVTDPQLFHRQIEAIESRGQTNLHGGWLKGAGEVSDGLDTGQVARVILLSDGMANVGLRDPFAIAEQCREMASAGVSTSTYGIARQFNEELMVEMAQAGGGNHYFGELAEDLLEPFREEFSLLQALCARSVRLNLRPADGIRFELLNNYRRNPDGTINLPDLAYEGEAWAVVRLTIPKAALEQRDVNGNVTLLEASVSYKNLDGVEQHLPKTWFTLPLLPADAWRAVADDQLVDRRAGELEAAAYQLQARRAAREHNWEEVARLLSEAKERAENNPWIAESITALEEMAARQDNVMFMKEALYSSSKMHSRLADKHELRNDSAGMRESGKEGYLRRKRRQGKSQFGDGDNPSSG